jgi:hypothetical protein
MQDVAALNAAKSKAITLGHAADTRAQQRLPVELRQQLLDAIYAGQPFRTVLRDLGLTSNQVWGLCKTNPKWSAVLDAALTATRRDDLKHGTTPAYVRGCVCKECREHQRRRMSKNRASSAARDRRKSQSGIVAEVV